MSAVNELNAAMYSKLSAAGSIIAALGGTALYFLQAPDDAHAPYIVWDWNVGRENNDTAHRIKDETVFVRGYAETSDAAGTLDALIDAQLHGGTLSVSGWTNFWLKRTADFSAVDVDPSGRRVYMAGGNYAITIERT